MKGVGGRKKLDTARDWTDDMTERKRTDEANQREEREERDR